VTLVGDRGEQGSRWSFFGIVYVFFVFSFLGRSIACRPIALECNGVERGTVIAIKLDRVVEFFGFL
jgi:hypothetical protein